MSNKNYRSKNHRVYSCQYHVIICPKYRKKVFKYGIDIRLKEIILETAKLYQFEIPDIEGKKQLVVTKDVVTQAKKIDVKQLIKSLPEKTETA